MQATDTKTYVRRGGDSEIRWDRVSEIAGIKISQKVRRGNARQIRLGRYCREILRACSRPERSLDRACCKLGVFECLASSSEVVQGKLRQSHLI